MIKRNSKGFTLIELLVVISIIGLLSSVVLASLNTARGKARDARRVHDMNTIRTALYFYFDKYGNFVEGAGCGSGGSGYFNFSNGTSYPKSIAQCLIDAGVVSQEIIDPTGGRTPNASNNTFGYMKYNCNSPRKIYIMARLETRAVEDGPTNNLCNDSVTLAGYDTSYGMNYVISIDRP